MMDTNMNNSSLTACSSEIESVTATTKDNSLLDRSNAIGIETRNTEKKLDGTNLGLGIAITGNRFLISFKIFNNKTIFFLNLTQKLITYRNIN